ncbi:MAG: NAD(P)H-dependent oxidoreductase, partial [candidate division WOR-3 bacterium]
MFLRMRSRDMKILAINGTCRKKGTTTRLTEAALAGAASLGAETDMVLLQNHDVGYCTNCLKC